MYNRQNKQNYMNLMTERARHKYNNVIEFSKDPEPSKGKISKIKVMKRSQIHGAAQVKKMLDEQIRMQLEIE